MEDLRVNDKVDFGGCKGFFESFYHIPMCGGRVLEHVSDSTFSVSTNVRAKNVFDSLMKLIAVVVFSILTLAIPFLIRQVNRSGVKIKAQSRPPAPPKPPRSPSSHTPLGPSSRVDQTDQPSSPGLDDNTTSVSTPSPHTPPGSSNLIDQTEQPSSPGLVDVTVSTSTLSTSATTPAHATIAPVKSKLEAKALIAYMTKCVAWSKTPEARREIELCDDGRLSETDTCSKVLTNLYIGGETCLSGVLDHGATERSKKWTFKPTAGVKATLARIDNVMQRDYRPDELLFPDEAKRYDEVHAFKNDSSSFTPYVAFAPKGNTKGSGKFGYVYTANHKGLSLSRGSAMDAAGKPSCTPKVFLHPAHQVGVAIEENPRHMIAELKFNFDNNLTNDTDYFNALAQIDHAVDILHNEEAKGADGEPIIVHCSSGKERSVTTTIGILLRNLQRQEIEITQELIQLTVAFVQARRASATDFNDEVQEHRLIRMSHHQLDIMLLMHKAGIPYDQHVMREVTQLDGYTSEIIENGRVKMEDFNVDDWFSSFMEVRSGNFSIDEERYRTLVCEYVKKRVALTPEVEKAKDRNINVALAKQNTMRQMVKNKKGFWVRSGESSLLECKMPCNNYRSIHLMFSYVMRLLQENPQRVSKPEDLIHPMRDRPGFKG